MSFEIWLAYLATVLAFMITPGPSHLLMLSNSMTHGFRPSLATAAGDLTANALQMLAAGLGLAAILVTSQNALTIIKWAGVAYLIWMGFRMWRNASHAKTTAGAAPSASLKILWGRVSSLPRQTQSRCFLRSSISAIHRPKPSLHSSIRRIVGYLHHRGWDVLGQLRHQCELVGQQAERQCDCLGPSDR